MIKKKMKELEDLIDERMTKMCLACLENTSSRGREEHTAFTFPILPLGSGPPWLLHKGFSKTKRDHTATQRNPFSSVPATEHRISSDLRETSLLALYVQ